MPYRVRAARRTCGCSSGLTARVLRAPAKGEKKAVGRGGGERDVLERARTTERDREPKLTSSAHATLLRLARCADEATTSTKRAWEAWLAQSAARGYAFSERARASCTRVVDLRGLGEKPSERNENERRKKVPYWDVRRHALRWAPSRCVRCSGCRRRGKAWTGRPARVGSLSRRPRAREGRRTRDGGSTTVSIPACSSENLSILLKQAIGVADDARCSPPRRVPLSRWLYSCHDGRQIGAGAARPGTNSSVTGD